MEPISNDELAAVSALCRAAMIYERMLMQCFEARPELMEQVAKPHLELIEMAGATIQHWREYLEITDE